MAAQIVLSQQPIANSQQLFFIIGLVESLLYNLTGEDFFADTDP